MVCFSMFCNGFYQIAPKQIFIVLKCLRTKNVDLVVFSYLLI